MLRTALFFGLLALVPIARGQEAGKNVAPEAAYLPSQAISGLTIHDGRQSIGDGDNWPITWADDGDLYTVYCDGKGFGGGSGEGSMSLAKVTGSPPEIRGENIASASGHKTGGGPEGRKASGLLMIDGVLYMWVRNLNKDGTGSSLAWSSDHARTWEWADWSFPEIGYPVWMNAGRNYEAAQDDYAYMYSPDTPSAYKTSDHVLLSRVPKGRVTVREAYEFFAGLNVNGQPTWAANIAERKPVFTDPGHCYRPEVVFNPGLKRYLLLTATSGSPRWCGTEEKYLGVFDAPSPWGPWTAVKQIGGWGGDENRFQPRVPAKWISDDGRSIYLLYSCFPKGPYQFNVEKCAINMAASGNEARRIEVALRKSEDRVEIQVQDGQAVIDVSSESGIGSATVTRRNGPWPTIVLRLRLRGLESLRLTTDKATVQASASNSGDQPGQCHRIRDGIEEPLGTDSPYYVDIRHVKTAGEDHDSDYFEVIVPRALLDNLSSRLRIEWIDFYRG